MSRRSYFFAVAAVYAFAVCVVSFGGFVFTNDGPCHLFGGFVHTHADVEALGFSDLYLINFQPTSRGYLDLYLAFASIFDSWLVCHQLVVVAGITVWLAGALSFAWALNGGPALSHVVIAGLVFQTGYFMGFWPYILGTGLALLAVAAWLRWPDKPQLVVPLGLVLFFLAARCHVIAAALCGSIIGVDALTRGRRTVLWGALLALPIAAVAAQMRVEPSEREPYFVPLIENLTHYPDGFIPGPFWKTWPVLLLVFFSYTRAKSDRRWLVLLGFAYLILTVVLPRDFLGWEFAGWRMLPLACIVGLATLPDPKSPIGRGLVVAILLLQLGWTAWYHVSLKPESDQLLAALKKLEPHPRSYFPVVRTLPEQRPYLVAPYMHLGQVVALYTGGGSFYGHDTHPSVHPVLLKDGPLIPESASLKPRMYRGEPGDHILDAAIARASRLESLIYYGFPADKEHLERAGYSVFFQDDKLMLADFVGCPLAVRLHNVQGPVDLAIGFGRAVEATSEFSLNPGNQTDHELPIERFACGERWLRVRGQKQTCHARGREVLECTLVERVRAPDAETTPPPAP